MHQLSVRHRVGMLLRLSTFKRTQHSGNQRRFHGGIQSKERCGHRALTARLTLSATAACHIRQDQGDSALSRHINTEGNAHAAGLGTNLLRSQTLAARTWYKALHEGTLRCGALRCTHLRGIRLISFTHHSVLLRHEPSRTLEILLTHHHLLRYDAIPLIHRGVSLMQGAVKSQVAFFSLHKRVRLRTFRGTQVGVLVRNMSVIDSVRPLGKSHAAASRHEAVATIQRRGVAARVRCDLLILLRERTFRHIGSFSRICRLREALILIAEDARRTNRRHIKTGGRHQRQLRGNTQQLQHRLQR